MDSVNIQQLSLPRAELELLIDLIESERRELHGEIHRTDSHDYRAKLAQRLELVERTAETLGPK